MVICEILVCRVVCRARERTWFKARHPAAAVYCAFYVAGDEAARALRNLRVLADKLKMS